MENEQKMPGVRTMALTGFGAALLLKIVVGGQMVAVIGAAQLVAIIVSGLTGFGLGWIMSPSARKFRIAALVAISALLLLLGIGDARPAGISITTLGCILAFFAALFYWIGGMVRGLSRPPTTFGSAEWATLPYLEEHGVVGSTGFRLGGFATEGAIKPLHYEGDRHALTIAPTRAGKGVSAIIPNLLSYRGSVLVVDPKGENAMITANHRHAMGQDVHIVDPWGITGANVLARFNPLDWLVEGDADIAENAMLLADALVVPDGKGEGFWDEEAKAYLQGNILYVATDPREAGCRHLGRVRDLMLLDGDDLKALYQRMLESPHHLVVSTGARCLQKEERLLSNVIASAQSHTHFLDSARMRESLSASDFSFDALKTKPMSIYLVLPSDRLNAFNRWLRLLIQQAITVNARNIAVMPDKPVLFLLDEMPALGRLTMVEQAFGLMAGFGIQLWGIVQDVSQLKSIYGEGWETFIGNSGMIQYFGSRDRMTAEYFQALCGVTTVWNLSSAIARAFSTSSGQGGISTSSSTTTTETTAASQRQLAYADELMRMHRTKQLILIENLNPIIGTKVPWFKDDALKHLGVNLHVK